MLFLAILLGLTGCHGPIGVKLRPSVARPDPGVVVFLCDGVQADRLEEGIREGWLPNFRDRFHNGGTRVETAVTVVPTITYAAITSLLTGVPPASHGVIGNQWFEPTERLFRDYATIRTYRFVNDDFEHSTLYEALPAACLSYSVQAAHSRGVSRNIANWAQSGVRWFFGAYTGVDALTATTMRKIAREANERRRWPDLVMLYFPGADTVGHLHGPDSPEYRHALENLDRHIGRACDWLESQGLLETTTLILTSDHGIVRVRRTVDLESLVRDGWGLPVTSRPLQSGSASSRARLYDRYVAVLVRQNGRIAFLHLAGATGWDERPAPARVAGVLNGPSEELRLWNVAGVELVAWLSGPREATIRGPRGAGRIEMRDRRGTREFRYVPVPQDVLGYCRRDDLAGFVRSGFHTASDWFQQTHAERLPSVVPALIPLLHHPRSGDVVVLAAAGASFSDEAGGHGGLDRREMRIPLYGAGPGFEAGATWPRARIVDIAPTILSLLGASGEAAAMPGVSLVPPVSIDTNQNTIQP